VQNGGFTELGAGSVDVDQALQPLLRAEYDGWLCVELELTTSTPRESATTSRDFLRQRLHW
ncbi:MAG: xylose isomerase, partial [Chloroflexota bacterium]|nr:xylose isomerase [Chloroflexota bacterium]